MLADQLCSSSTTSATSVATLQSHSSLSSPTLPLLQPASSVSLLPSATQTWPGRAILAILPFLQHLVSRTSSQSRSPRLPYCLLRRPRPSPLRRATFRRPNSISAARPCTTTTRILRREKTSRLSVLPLASLLLAFLRPRFTAAMVLSPAARLALEVPHSTVAEQSQAAPSYQPMASSAVSTSLKKEMVEWE